MSVQELILQGQVPLRRVQIWHCPPNLSFSLELLLSSRPVGCYRVGIASPALSFCHQAVVTFSLRESQAPVAHISVLSRKHLSFLLSVQAHPP